jgi:hypothetical protein
VAPTDDAELEKTHTYALFLLLISGLLLVGFNLVPFFNRGSEFQVHADGSMSVRTDDSWEPLPENQYSTVTADGRTACTPAHTARGCPPRRGSGSSSLTARRR